MGNQNTITLECSFLIPLTRDAEIADGNLHASAAWRWLEEELFARFGGMTVAPGAYEGIWRSERTKAKIGDRSKKYTVALPRAQMPRLRAVLRSACRVFCQQCLFLSVAGHVEFIEAKIEKRPGRVR